MPDDVCDAAQGLLGQQFARLSRLLQQLNDGRGWPSDPAAQADAEFIAEHAKSIEASLDEIARVVALIKGTQPS